ncbi:MAG: Bug family tripartite tricarboxylate transporter substrate binding protein [Burkholderiales bacterium]
MGLLAAIGIAAPAFAQSGWKPSRSVMFIVPNAVGGTSDRAARTLQRIMQVHKLIDVPIVIVNRPGGSGTLALTQLHSSSTDGHVMMLMNSITMSAHIAGLTPYSHADFTPLALLVDEYYGVHVRADSPLRSATDLLARLRKAPDALTFGSASPTGDNYLSLLRALKTGGIDVKRAKVVSFPGGAEIALALLGGHVDVTHSGLGNVLAHVREGRMRVLAISGPKRLWGPFADVPTWKEAGVDMTASGWRGVLGPKDLPQPQVAYWQEVLRKVTQTPEWKQDLDKNFWVDAYANAAETRRRLDREYAEIKQAMSALGMAKVK